MTITAIDYAPRESFTDAANAAGIGYQDPALLSKAAWGKPSLIDLPDCFAPFLTAIAVASMRRHGWPIRVLDYGGVNGHYRNYVAAMFADSIATEWTVIETRMQVEHLRRHESYGLRFATSLDELAYVEHVRVLGARDRKQNGFDFVLLSGVLQYLPDWQPVVGHPIVTAAPFIFIGRTPLGEEHKPFLQTVTYSDKKVRYPGCVVAKEKLFERLSCTHALFASWALAHDLGRLGRFEAPSMLWRRR